MRCLRCLTIPGLLLAAVSNPMTLPVAEAGPKTGEAGPVWHTDYASAVAEADRQDKMLLIVFHAPEPTRLDRHFRSAVLSKAAVRRKLAGYVCVRLPLDATTWVQGGKRVTLIEQPAFKRLEGRPGLAIIDLAHKDAPFYNYTVTAMPFDEDACYSVAQVSVVLDLPPGSLETRKRQYVRRIRKLASNQSGPRSRPPAALPWHSDYAEAWREASTRRKMLFILFYDPSPKGLGRRYESEVLGSAAVRKELADYVLAKLPLDARFDCDSGRTVILEDPAFAEMLKSEGVAILDFVHEDCRQYGCVVSTFPFLKGRLFTVDQTRAMLELPPGTLTQRTLIYAVRTHPDRPASTQGKLDAVLAGEAESHSDHQARIQLQGHHNWETRFHRINARLPQGYLATEVCAESWPGEPLLQAAIECVRCWRYSTGHWSAVRARHGRYGYDMKRGANGIWYATGIFGGRRH